MELVTIIGTRPEIIKMSRLIPLLDKKFDHKLIYTGQHYSREMCNVFFNELVVRKPDYFLDTKSSNVGILMEEVYKTLKRLKPSHVILYGDTNSTLAAARAAKLVDSKLIHIEAGLRCYDNRVPEEKNRVEIDKLSDFFFTPTKLTEELLAKEGVINNVYVVGNTVVDACMNYLYKANKSQIVKTLGLSNKKFILLTAHRQENVDDINQLNKIVETLSLLKHIIVYPIHPRTKTMLEKFKIKLPKNVIPIDPVGYFDFLKLLKECCFVITDSGGVQEEAITLKTPCVSIRESTERWETILSGANFLTGINPELISFKTKFIIEAKLKERIKNIKNPYGNGNTSVLICKTLSKICDIS